VSEFQSAYPLILNKVASPHFVTPTLRRARLLDWLHSSANCRATVIAADAGYGKTTLLWQWEREVDFPCYWYKLDRNDRDWTLHVSYLAQAIAQRHHGFGRRTHSMLQQVTGPGVSRPGVAAYLLAEMHDRLTEPCTFIIDDWQFVNAVTEVRGLWNQILRDAPPTCRFVFASRAKPRLQFARFKTHGGYASIGTDALRFTADEVESLFREIYNSPLEAAELRKLEERTEGWAASLHLVSVSLRDRTDEQRKAFIESLSATTDSDLFEFLAEEVVDQESPDTRDLLLTTSILQQITPELAERLAGVQDGVRELMALEHRGLFTYRLDEGRYRYHNLFRDYLKRRLAQERSEAEVSGLHIHAASYFETSQQWPEAIHHYLRAGLQRQAARLLARHGEQLVAEGRLDLIGEWLGQLPQRMIRENARLSLLLGEFAGFQADWTTALEALESARTFFAKKGDQRMQALACVKLSSIHHYRGDAELGSAAAREGLQLVSPDDVATRLRLEGNLDGLAHEHLESVATVCRRVATDAAAHGLEHFSAIGWHNLGCMQLYMAEISDAVISLERASTFWGSLPPNPMDDRATLTIALLAADRIEAAERASRQALERSKPWRRSAYAAAQGMAEVFAYRGRFAAASAVLDRLRADLDALGHVNIMIGWTHTKALYLSGAPPDKVASAALTTQSGAQDERHWSASLGLAVARHARPDCSGECLDATRSIREMENRGYRLQAIEGLTVMASLAIDHRRRDAVPLLREALQKAAERRLLRYVRWWSRRCTAATRQLAKTRQGAELLVQLLEADPEGWRGPIASQIRHMSQPDRSPLLAALTKYPNRETIDQLAGVEGADVAEARRELSNRMAPRLYVRTFGALAIHRNSWRGPEVVIEKRRLRQLLSLLIAHSGRILTRDEAADILWPEADAISAGNSLNQAVFQLRRVVDPSYRDGESPAYVVTGTDTIQLNPHLVQTDVDEVKRLERASSGPDEANSAAASKLDLIKGAFLPELRYEDWGASIQASVNAEVRALLLPIAERGSPQTSADLAVRAACGLVEMDPFDERGQIALANAMSADGRRVAAREALSRFAARLHRELDEPPSERVTAVLEALGSVH
jgi:ATP/maltotriose-dependent transcriptional regulator MalT/DNA-binding SARP family transcriptional activator